MLVAKSPSPAEFNEGITLSIGDGSVRIISNNGNPNDTGVVGSPNTLVIDTETGLIYRYIVETQLFEPAADVTQLPYPGPTPIRINQLNAIHELDRVDMNSVRSIVWDVSIRNADSGMYSSSIKAIQLLNEVAYTEFSILEIGDFPTYLPALSVIADGTDMILRYEGDANMSASILRQQAEVENG